MIPSDRSFVLSCKLSLVLTSLYFECADLTESLFSSHKDEYPEHEQASLKQLYQAKV